MTYQIYRTDLNMTDYFTHWEDDNLNTLTKELKNHIYKKYLVKCRVLRRDDFKCQHIDCTNPTIDLTMHHVKWQKNGGEDKERNCLTVCRTCHNLFHKGRLALVLADVEYLPKNMRGMTYKLDIKREINWKQVRKDMKTLRKSLKDQRVFLSMEQLKFLMMFIEGVVDYDDDFDGG